MYIYTHIYVCIYTYIYTYVCVCVCVYIYIYRVFNLKIDPIYLLKFTTYYITQLTYIYSKCWK